MSKSKKQATSYSKYSYTGKSASSFWYDDYETNYDYLGEYGGYEKKDLDAYKRSNNLYKLASVRRAISNFVQIVTNKSIPVTFATKSESKTDGEKVILSADVDDKFDVSVGLALHEGSHIILSDFKLLGAMSKCRDRYVSTSHSIKRQNQQATAEGNTLPFPNPIAELDRIMVDQIKVFPKYDKQLRSIFLSDGKIGSKGMLTDEVIDTISGLTNWIEDRRIDMYIYKSAPGYRDYYTSMYDHYFNDKVVTKGIASDEFTDETIQSYMFRIINFMNENTDLSKLKGLRAIYRMLDLKNINRLNTSTDAMNVAIDVMDIILTNVMSENEGQMPQSGAGKGTTGENGTGEETEGENGENGGSEDGVAPTGTGDESGEDNGGNSMGADGDTPEDIANPKPGNDGKLSKSAAEQLAKKFQKQKDFLNGNIKKKSVSKEEVNKLSEIQESESELVRVGGGVEGGYGRISQGVDCIVVKKLTSNLMKSSDFPFASVDWGTKEPIVWAEDEVRRGITLGTMLGKKLQIRSESRETVFSRLKKGRIDKRMIASLGYDNEGVFYTNEVDQFKKGNLHISLDYSGSMSGSKLKKTITSVVAIVKACEMARNLNVQVSIRSTDSGRGGKSLPYICLIHDSRRDSFKQFAKYMSILDCSNTTPEGLCFEAIQKYLIPTDNSVDSYFLNFSDGQPCYNISSKTDCISYNGISAAEHTNKQVKKMRDSGINVLSYFITERSDDRFESSNDWDIFKKSYDKSAKHVNVENVMQVAKSMNELFLQKSNRD